MKGILAIETATEACSVAIWRDPELRQRHEIAPRQHSQLLMGMLRELLPNGQLQAHGVEAIAYGCGPGSFTGLRIAASAVQGLAYASELPAIPVSTLACQVQTALRQKLVREGDVVLSSLDARINEIYYASYRIEDGAPVALQSAQACAPAQVDLPANIQSLTAIGSGVDFLDACPQTVRNRINDSYPKLVPEAQDLIPLALILANRGELQAAREVHPVYVRDEINWKKLSEQGKQS
ncbi:MAG: tRNA (adenosine(37)-N6)-threonylcarbamoyltransferase complex dimerization subunit type 1 TsaB [Halioglobus sp.]